MDKDIKIYDKNNKLVLKEVLNREVFCFIEFLVGLY